MALPVNAGNMQQLTAACRAAMFLQEYRSLEGVPITPHHCWAVWSGQLRAAGAGRPDSPHLSMGAIPP